MVWSNELIKECPFEWVKTIKLEKFSGLLINKEENKLFQPTTNMTICDSINVLSTAEGFYLSQDKQVLKLDKAGEDLKIIDELLLSEIDYNQMSLLQLVTNLFAITNVKMCQLYKSFVNLYSKLDDEFFTFSDFTGNEAILYSNEGQIFLPTCITINHISLVPETSKCYRDIPITLELNNQTITAFLTKEKIIRVMSKLVPCVNNHVNIHLPKTKRIISMKENRTIIQDDSMYKHIPLTLQFVNVTTFNFHHDKQIISSINLVKKTSKVIVLNEGNNGDFFVKEDHMTSLRDQVSALVKELPHPLEWLQRLAINTCAIAAIVLVLVIGSILLYAGISRNKRSSDYIQYDYQTRPSFDSVKNESK
jgi:hypothetical protein